MSALADKITKPLKVLKKIRETNDAYSLLLEIPPELKNSFSYKPGQFVTFFLNINGEELSRSYSLSTSPEVDTDFKVTVKRVANGKGSNFLIDQVQEGDFLKVTPPAGFFFKASPKEQAKHYLLFAAGSGITPIFSILKSVLTINSTNKVDLIFANRDEDSIIYKNELNGWLGKFNGRLTIVDVLSKPKSAAHEFKGRCTEEMLLKILNNKIQPSTLPTEIYICGPVGFMDTVKLSLKSAGFTTEQIHEENFGPIAAHEQTPEPTDGRVYIGDPLVGAEVPEKIEAHLDGQNYEAPAVAEQTILETLIEAGANPPYSCMDGACMACMAKLVSGRVYQKDPGILTEENIANKDILTCQARPLSKTVKVSFDIF